MTDQEIRLDGAPLLRGPWGTGDRHTVTAYVNILVAQAIGTSHFVVKSADDAHALLDYEFWAGAKGPDVTGKGTLRFECDERGVRAARAEWSWEDDADRHEAKLEMIRTGIQDAPPPASRPAPATGSAPARSHESGEATRASGDGPGRTSTPPTSSPPPPSPALTENEKIEALIGIVARTKDAVFLRNDAKHDPAEAAEHMRDKWEWRRRDIRTARDFIRIAASESSTSGRPYRIRFADGREVTSREFLLAELERIERAGIPASRSPPANADAGAGDPPPPELPPPA